MTQPSTVSGSNAGTVNPKDEPDKGSKHAGDEGLGIQRKLAWFTGALVVIGILQVFALCGQVYIYCRQAKIMARQAHEMKRQRGYMRLQWKSMGEQAVLMEEQLKEMQEAGKRANGQAQVFERSVAASEKSADAAKENIELYISKERARLRIEFKPLSLMPKFDTTNFYTVDFDVAIDGPTAAYVTKSSCVAFAMPSQVIDEEEVGSAIMMNMALLPQVILPNTAPTEHFALFLSDSEGIHNLLPEIKSGNFLVGIRGFICYRDVFDRNHETAFRYAWRFDEFFADGKHGRWEKCGKPEENRET